MDYNIKKENRKKFQDKTKLKRHHKKNYAKVVKPTTSESQDSEELSSDEYESENEDQQLDEDGNPIPNSDGEGSSDQEDKEPQLGYAIPQPARRRRKKKLQSNAWRYEESLEENLDDELEQKELEEALKDIDFAKLSMRKEIDLGGSNKKIDVKKLSNAELSKIKITDKNNVKPRMPMTSVLPNRKFGKPSNEGNQDPLDDLLGLPVKKDTLQKKQEPDHVNNTPLHLKSDESFLDDLL
ncbi:hypothetical protein WICPIJ_001889 [Wickerhamomyces pijperi]|uniref:Uncharacterized protein n=1 Tax=Wickerhamomyces pijperi TaxID=599730 RepID=A0A9P8QCT5_WICPI|nr:hypothetical protein WICPIJ_001889 [Wickerhamomyces pijperi]